jgi:hypothetical protein
MSAPTFPALEFKPGCAYLMFVPRDSIRQVAVALEDNVPDDTNVRIVAWDPLIPVPEIIGEDVASIRLWLDAVEAKPTRSQACCETGMRSSGSAHDTACTGLA